MPKAIKKSRALSHGRPPLSRSAVPESSSLPSSRTTRTLIRTHHTLHKALSVAKRTGDSAVNSIQAEIDALGGLPAYQTASIAGQSKSRGGDSSRILVEWLRAAKVGNERMRPDDGLRLLEVGALSTTNAVTRAGIFASTTHIDLHAAAPGILQQDFMARPLPACEAERFDVLSLSLVLNYVPEPAGRWKMLRRTCAFLRCALKGGEREGSAVLPALFLVLPAPCVDNSRYLNRDRLQGMMAGLGYEVVHERTTAKLVYYLYTWHGFDDDAKKSWPKVEVNPGSVRNNFAITSH